MPQRVESWQVMAMSDEFFKICQAMPPECATASSILMGEREIKGARCILKARSMGEIKAKLPALIKELTGADYAHLKVVYKTGWCYECKTKEGEDCNTASNDCPHIGNGEVIVACESWTVDKKKFQAT